MGMLLRTWDTNMDGKIFMRHCVICGGAIPEWLDKCSCCQGENYVNRRNAKDKEKRKTKGGVGTNLQSKSERKQDETKQSK